MSSVLDWAITSVWAGNDRGAKDMRWNRATHMTLQSGKDFWLWCSVVSLARAVSRDVRAYDSNLALICLCVWHAPDMPQSWTAVPTGDHSQTFWGCLTTASVPHHHSNQHQQPASNTNKTRVNIRSRNLESTISTNQHHLSNHKDGGLQHKQPTPATNDKHLHHILKIGTSISNQRCLRPSHTPISNSNQHLWHKQPTATNISDISNQHQSQESGVWTSSISNQGGQQPQQP